jgi:hypothetical protein
MKKTHLFLLLIAIFVACGGLSSPKKVAAAFTESVAHGKIDQAKKLSTESTGKMLDFAAMMKMPVKPDYKFQFLKDSIVGNEAWVSFIDADKREATLHLVKIDGKWKVHIENNK